jgi:DNA-3-methyladenine glycosylase
VKLPVTFYQSSDVVGLARNLIGKHLFTKINGKITAGMITETEAYAGVIDRASHAFAGRRTERTEVMYLEGGCCYIYLCYGVHYLFNVVTGKENEPHAVLIRGIYPVYGIDTILKRIKQKEIDDKLFNGPGKLSKALGISIEQNGMNLTGDKIWIEDVDTNYPDEAIQVSERIGVHYAGEDAKLPYRFFLKPEFLTKKKSA